MVDFSNKMGICSWLLLILGILFCIMIIANAIFEYVWEGLIWIFVFIFLAFIVTTSIKTIIWLLLFNASFDPDFVKEINEELAKNK